MNPQTQDEIEAIRRSKDRRETRAFTIVELLVVIAVMGLLAAILSRTAQQAGRRARAVACLCQLRQWGVGLSAFASELDPPVDGASFYVWDRFYRPDYHQHCSAFICPMATRYETNPADPNWMVWEGIGCGLGSTFTAWKLPLRTPAAQKSEHLLGSYGLNHAGVATLTAQPRGRRNRNPSNMPVLVDCVSWGAQACYDEEPPRYEGELTGTGLRNCCINRHDGGVNSLFLDWSARKVGLKELWTLQWSSWFDVQNAWTHAGGVQPEDWPAWMRRFEDY